MATMSKLRYRVCSECCSWGSGFWVLSMDLIWILNLGGLFPFPLQHPMVKCHDLPKPSREGTKKNIIYKHTCCVQNCALPGWADFPRSRGAVLQDDHVALTPSIASQVSGVLAKCLPKSSRPLCFTKVSTTPQ